MRSFLVVLIACLLTACSSGTAADSGPSTPADSSAAAEDPRKAQASPEASAPADKATTEGTASITHFGGEFSLTDPIRADRLLDTPGDFSSGPILVVGEVLDVCQKAGCWMVLTEANKERTIRVVMKDHSFAVAKDGAGSMARIEGTLINRTPDEERIAHLESESARKDKVPERSGQTWELEATAVQLRRSPKKS